MFFMSQKQPYGHKIPEGPPKLKVFPKTAKGLLTFFRKKIKKIKIGRKEDKICKIRHCDANLRKVLAMAVVFPEKTLQRLRFKHG